MKRAVKTGMKRTRTPWAAKLRVEMKPKVVEDPRGRGRMLVPTPLLVAESIQRVGSGQLITPIQIRRRLAERFSAAVTCPLTTGIFFNIIAGAVEEQIGQGQEPLAPYWRVVKEDGRLSEKTPPGAARQAEHLSREGHKVVKRGRPAHWQVEDFETKLVKG